MKKTRVIRALKNCKSTDFKPDSVLSFKDEKGKEYFLAEQPHYMNIITNSINALPYSSNAYLEGNSGWLYGKFKKLPVPFEFNSICFGNISQSP